ncbi:hypothetical protein GG851_22340 [Bordetella petrii]|nr:hypothetical protein [Bordetella petrii]
MQNQPNTGKPLLSNFVNRRNMNAKEAGAMKKIGFIGNPMRLPPLSRDNTGNIVHGHAARALFADPVDVKSDRSDENIEKVRERITHLGLIAATMLHTKKPPKYIDGHDRAADFIEKLDLPVCAFGFGCHAGINDTISEANVDSRTLRLLRAIAERSETVGVRGEFTADLCVKYGVKNVSVVGCQSAYIAAALNIDGLSGNAPILHGRKK